MIGFELFDIASWLDSDGLLLRNVVRAKRTASKATQIVGQAVVAATVGLGASTLSAASPPTVMPMPDAAQSATAPRPTVTLTGGSLGSADDADPQYWAALTSKLKSWKPVVESSAASPEPLD